MKNLLRSAPLLLIMLFGCTGSETQKEAALLRVGGTAGELEEMAGQMAAGTFKVCWAKVTDIAPNPGSCGRSFCADQWLGRWLWMKCNDDVCPWDPDGSYAIVTSCPGSGFCRVVVSDITNCTTRLTPPGN